MHRTVVFSGLFVGLSLSASIARAAPGDLVADRVLGQSNFRNSAPSFVERRGMHDPSSLAIDRSSVPNRLYVADYDNSRVLGWENAAAFKKGAPASLVIGQATFNAAYCNRGIAAAANTLCFPTGLAVDGDGDLYVADNLNHRVLLFESPFESGVRRNQSASRVFGHADFESQFCNRTSLFPSTPSPQTLCGPAGVAVDADGNVFISDGLSIGGYNRRVLEYDDPKAAGGGTPGVPGSDGDTTADRVFGTTGFDTAGPFGGCSANASTVCAPSDLAIGSSGDLFVTDSLSHRVLVFLDALSDGETGAVADHVFGQPDFTSSSPGQGLDGLSLPAGVAIDAGGRVWVADAFNHRVIEYDAPLAGDKVGDLEVGTTGSFPSRSSFGSPADVDFDVDGNLYVADGMPPANYEGGYSRVLRLNDPLTTDLVPDALVGQPLYRTSLPNRVDPRGLRGPRGVALDRSVSPPRVYVVDGPSNRVLGWTDADDFSNGRAADLVIGQPSFNAHDCNQAGIGAAPAANTLCNPFDVAVDASGNLWVADYDNNRVLGYDSPFESGRSRNQSAARVLGRADFTARQTRSAAGAAVLSAVTAANTLSSPSALAVDGQGNLWVADSGNYRVVVFADPLDTDATADDLLGQPDLTSNSVPTGPTADNILSPFEVAVDEQGNIYVGDPSYDRVLVYLDPLTTGGGTPGTPGSSGDRTADRVFGQADFTSPAPFDRGCNNFGGTGGRRAQSLCGVARIAVDGAGDLWIVDGGNHRVLRYDDALTGDPIADALIGPADFITSGISCGSPRTASTFCFPHGIDIGPSGDLWVTDLQSGRVLVFDEAAAPQ